jgi:Uma2 family endonuclease
VSRVPTELVGRRLTLADYEALPDDQEYEIIDGALYVAPRPLLLHQRLAYAVSKVVAEHAEPAGLGFVVPDADLVVDEHGTYVSPDVMYFTAGQYAAIDPEKMIRVAPTLVVEVLSESTMGRDRLVKRDAYARIGVPHYWMVDRHRRSIVELVLGPDGRYGEREVAAPEVFRPSVFPGLAIDLERLFG